MQCIHALLRLMRPHFIASYRLQCDATTCVDVALDRLVDTDVRGGQSALLFKADKLTKLSFASFECIVKLHPLRM